MGSVPKAGDGVKRTSYSRRFLRIRPCFPLHGRIRIVQIGEKRVHSGQALVRLLDLGCGGARFESVLRLPADRKVTLELSMSLDGTEYRLKGRIVSSKKKEIYGYEYGLCFLEPEHRLRKPLQKIFGQHEKYIVFRMQRDQ